MTAPDTKLRQLLERDEWTVEERQWLLQYLETSDSLELREMMLAQLQAQLAREASGGDGFEGADHDVRAAEDLAVIHRRIGAGTRRAGVVRVWGRWAAAACVAGLIGFGVMRLARGSHEAPGQPNAAVVKRQDVAPGTNKAVLTLADGSTITLDDAQNGNLTQQGNTKVLKLNGKLAYQSGGQSKEVLYNSIATPRGGQYQIELPDGTQVWLNAASSIRFPTAFTGRERRVEVTGEAYFEVAKRSGMPFVVQAARAEVHVLGTHFNIMAYKEEDQLRATLLEGSVRFSSGGSSNILRPGQQSRLSQDGRVTIEDDVNVDEVVAWKNGLFHFERAGIESVMRQLSRWYDVEVVYQQLPSPDKFHADIPKNTNLSTALKVLELTGKVHFHIEGKKVVVLP